MGQSAFATWAMSYSIDFHRAIRGGHRTETSVKEVIGSKEAFPHWEEKFIKGDEESVLHFLFETIQTSILFRSFYSYCREQGIDVQIVSDGL